MAGEIGEGERIAESRLAEQIGVSRTPIREALQRLEGDGLVIAQGRGIRVRMLDVRELDALYAARAGLEGWAAYLAALRVGEGEIAPARLDALEQTMTRTHELTLAGDLAHAIESNRRFHEAVAALAENPVIDATLQRWWDQIILSTRRSLRAPERTHDVHSEHEEILRALREGDAPAARAAVEAHAFATRAALAADPETRNP